VLILERQLNKAREPGRCGVVLQVHAELTVDTFHPGFSKIGFRPIEITTRLIERKEDKAAAHSPSKNTGKEVPLSKRQSLLTQKYAHFADETSLLKSLKSFTKKILFYKHV
jgi:hypothetical protein